MIYQLLSFIGRHWPFQHGTGWLVERPSRLIKNWPINKQIHLKNGLIFQGNLNDPLYRRLFLYGEYEPLVMSAIEKMILKGELVVDIGANVGIITALMGRLVGGAGKVFSFEPVPFLYKQLAVTISLNHLSEIVIPESMAVSDQSIEKVIIYVPDNASNACSSLKVDRPVSATPYECMTITLDQALVDFLPSIPVLVKVDVEGAEMLVLQGANHLSSGERPPIWVIEVNHKTAKRFGFSPEDMLAFLAHRNYHHFYESDEQQFKILSQNDRLIPDGTLYCVPDWAISEGRQPV